MIFFVCTETREKYRNAIYAKVKMIFEDLAGDICLMLHYTDFNQTLIHRYLPWAIVYSGRGSAYDVDAVLETPTLRDAILNTNVPQLGICGGHQIIASYYGSRIDAIRKLRDNEPDTHPDNSPGYFKEMGVYPVGITKQDLLFEGMGTVIRVIQSHHWEVKELSPTLKIIASNNEVRIQAFTDPNRCLYGVQFHPERYTDEYPDGRDVLKNFFAVARDNNDGQTQ